MIRISLHISHMQYLIFNNSVTNVYLPQRRICHYFYWVNNFFLILQQF